MNNDVLDFASKHVYLVSGLAALLLLTVILSTMRPEWRRTTMICGVLSLPLSLMGLVLVPDYWRPMGVVQLPVLLEDFLFMFNTGIAAWLAGSWPYRDRLILGRIRIWAFLRRSMLMAGVILATGAVLHRFGMKVGLSIPVVWSACAGILLCLRPDLRAVMAAAAATFGVSYFAVVACVFAVAPDFTSAWNYNNLLGWKVLEVPVDEIVWAMGFGAVWPAFLVYATEGRILAATEQDGDRDHSLLSHDAKRCGQDIVRRW